MTTIDKEVIIKDKDLDAEYSLENIPDFSKITILLINLPQKDDKLTINNFYNATGNTEPENKVYNLKYSDTLKGYLVPDQNIINNLIVMEFLFKKSIDFFTTTVDITTYNTILYSGN